MTPLFGSHRLEIRPLGKGTRIVLDRRVIGVVAILVAIAAIIAVVSLGSGQVAFTAGEVIATLAGNGTPRAELVILEWRMPRVFAAIVIGALLGLAGAIFQAMTRNPLGSPDIVGFDAGSFTGALLVLMFGGGGWFVFSGSAVAGGLATGALIYFLVDGRHGFGFQIIVIGIGISAMLTAVNQWILLSLPLSTSMAAGVWATGTLSRATGPQTSYIFLASLPIVAAAFWLARPIAVMAMGDERASGLGVAVRSTRFVLLTLAIVGTALATALAGPIPFVALAAPQIANLLTRAPGFTLAGSMAVGSVLVLASDVLAIRIIAPQQIPVGLVTLCIGGGYFLWLLLRKERR